MIDVAFLKECFSYCPNSGELRWNHRPIHHFKSDHARKAWNGRYAGTVAGTVRKQMHRHNYRYLHVKVDGKMRMAHRVAWAIYHGVWPRDDQQVDHIDGNPMNNKIANLRLVSQAENGKNQKLHSNNSTGVSGVTWHSRDSRFQACISDSGRRVHLGMFDTLLDAVAARKSAESSMGYHENHGKRREDCA